MNKLNWLSRLNWREKLRAGWRQGRERYRNFPVPKKIMVALGLAAAVLAATGITYFSLSLFLISPAEIKLAELADSWNKEELCHEVCAAARRQAALAVADDLKNNPDVRTARLLKKYFLSATAGPEFKGELVRILAAAYGADNPPDYIKSYFDQSDGAPAVQAAILVVFRPAALNINAPAGRAAGLSPLADYFLILKSNRDLAVKQAAVEILSNEPDKAHNFSVSQLPLIRDLILDQATPPRLRQSLVLLLGDYFFLFPADTALILRIVYDSGVAGDEISRAFSADILNRLDGAKRPVPAVSPESWEEYYNN